MKTVKLDQELLSHFEGVVLLDPDGVDMDEFHQTHDALSRAQFLTSMVYVEGIYSPVLDTKPTAEKPSERYIGAEAIVGFLQNQGRF